MIARVIKVECFFSSTQSISVCTTYSIYLSISLCTDLSIINPSFYLSPYIHIQILCQFLFFPYPIPLYSILFCSILFCSIQDKIDAAMNSITTGEDLPFAECISNQLNDIFYSINNNNEEENIAVKNPFWSSDLQRLLSDKFWRSLEESSIEAIIGDRSLLDMKDLFTIVQRRLGIQIEQQKEESNSENNNNINYRNSSSKWQIQASSISMKMRGTKIIIDYSNTTFIGYLFVDHYPFPSYLFIIFTVQ